MEELLEIPRIIQPPQRRQNIQAVHKIEHFMHAINHYLLF